MRVISKLLISVLLISGIIFASLKWSQKEPSKKELDFHKKALVVTKWQTWEEIGDNILKVFNVSGDKNEWTILQYFGNDNEDLIESENYIKWRQCIYKKSDDTICFYREEEWSFKQVEQKWVLINQSFYKPN